MPPGRKPKPPGEKVGRTPQKHPWAESSQGGWQHEVPEPPDGLVEQSRKAWTAWFASWWAVNWTPEDIPTLELTVTLYDQAVRGDLSAVGKLTPMLDRLGITPKGRQDLRWAPPAGEVEDGSDGGVADEVAKRREQRRAKLA